MICAWCKKEASEGGLLAVRIDGTKTYDGDWVCSSTHTWCVDCGKQIPLNEAIDCENCGKPMCDNCSAMGEVCIECFEHFLLTADFIRSEQAGPAGEEGVRDETVTSH